jgi:peptide deformylase
MALPIVRFNEPVLRRKGGKVTVFDAELARFAADMVEAMRAAEGIGLAAQQVGRALQLCVVDLRRSDAEFAYELDGARPPRELFMPLVIANPQVDVPRRTPASVSEEGCLSFPGIRGDVARPERIEVRFSDEAGRAHFLACDGLLARCIQHEVDHLNGVLFIDRMDRKARAAIEGALKDLAGGKGRRLPAREPAVGGQY